MKKKSFALYEAIYVRACRELLKKRRMNEKKKSEI